MATHPLANDDLAYPYQRMWPRMQIPLQLTVRLALLALCQRTVQRRAHWIVDLLDSLDRRLLPSSQLAWGKPAISPANTFWAAAAEPRIGATRDTLQR